jgi:signal peptidase I
LSIAFNIIEEVLAMEESANNLQTPEPQPESLNWAKEIFEWVACFAIAIVVALLIKNFVFTLVKVDGASMNPTLENGDRLFTRVIFYSEPEQGDIVIFNPPVSATNKAPNEDIAYVKRVIATEGQVVDINEEGEVLVDGKVLKEDYISEKINTRLPYSARWVDFPFKVPKGTVFVLGDNRNNSHDSRSSDIGAVPIDNIIGKAEFRIWPLGNFGLYED